MNNIRFIRVVFLILSCLSLHSLQAGLEEFFRKAENKGGNHQMRNIDFIYMINLDQRPEKFAQSLADLVPYGITPYRFSAVNGWKLDHRALSEVGVKYNPETMQPGFMGTVYRYHEGKIYESHESVKENGITYFSHCLSRGAIGIVLSHLSILQDAWDSGYETIRVA